LFDEKDPVAFGDAAIGRGIGREADLESEDLIRNEGLEEQDVSMMEHRTSALGNAELGNATKTCRGAMSSRGNGKGMPGCVSDGGKTYLTTIAECTEAVGPDKKSSNTGSLRAS
jgi:hypothetical protein